MADPTPPFDRRITPWRDEVAAKHLEGKVKAARFVDGRAMELIAPEAPLRHEPRPDAPLDSEALKGERVTVYDANAEGWSWGQLEDGYVGWLPSAALATPGSPPTHKVAALHTFVFPGPSIRSPPVEILPFGAKLNIAEVRDRMAITSSGGYVPAAHLKPIADNEPDFVAVAERFVGAPYLWGGKTMLGIDCSGLVQLALSACGIACPRDSDMQEQALGNALSASRALAQLRRGDLLFWKGHVAIARDDATLVHASAQRMAVVFEPTAAAIARIRPEAGEVTAVRRLPSPA
jgi:cell wall-associated NlpC family hydrolase